MDDVKPVVESLYEAMEHDNEEEIEGRVFQLEMLCLQEENIPSEIFRGLIGLLNSDIARSLRHSSIVWSFFYSEWDICTAGAGRITCSSLAAVSQIGLFLLTLLLTPAGQASTRQSAGEFLPPVPELPGHSVLMCPDATRPHLCLPAGLKDSRSVPAVESYATWPSLCQPILARPHNAQVIVRYSVNTQGLVEDVYVVYSSPPGEFDNLAEKITRSFRFKPPLHDGKGATLIGLRHTFTFIANWIGPACA